MNCTQSQELTGAYVDGELDVTTTLEFERHVDRCPGCSQAIERVRGLSATIRDSGLGYKAPGALADRIRGAIGSPVVSKSASHPRRGWFFTVALAASLVLAAGLTWTIVRQVNAPGDLLARELVSAHVRSLQADHLLDVPSSDQHTVKPWFNGRLDFAPEVRDFADMGFPLEGGRLDYVDNRPVAALVYRHNKHVINCFVWPAGNGGASSSAVAETRQGYSIVRVTRHGLTYHAISDTAPATMDEFAKALQCDR